MGFCVKPNYCGGFCCFNSIIAIFASKSKYVDLGLPSGTLWATCNVGAANPEDFGYYYAWGETEPKSVYNWDTYKYYNGSDLTKYNSSDGLTILQSSDDAAMVNWGSNWQTPTVEQWQELIDNTTSEWTIRNGVYGRVFHGNGSIFLPAAGIRDRSSTEYAGKRGGYWSNGRIPYGYSGARALYFRSNSCGIPDGFDREYGMPVRPVRSVSLN